MIYVIFVSFLISHFSDAVSTPQLNIRKEVTFHRNDCSHVFGRGVARKIDLLLMTSAIQWHLKKNWILFPKRMDTFQGITLPLFWLSCSSSSTTGALKNSYLQYEHVSISSRWNETNQKSMTISLIIITNSSPPNRLVIVVIPASWPFTRGLYKKKFTCKFAK